MASQTPQRSPSPVYRRPKDDRGPMHTPMKFWDDHYGAADMSSLRNQDTIDPSESWFMNAIAALDQEHSIIPMSTISTRGGLDPLDVDFDDVHSVRSNNDTTLVSLDTQQSLTSEMEQKEEVTAAVNVLELVPKKNVVEDIKGIFRYIKQLGTGMQCI